MNVLQTTENGWAKDEILTQHIMEAMDTTKQEDFVFTVSVQGHGNYPETQVIENPKIKVEGIEDEALKNKWEYYVNQVYEMDQFVGDLIKAVEARKEPSVVVFYGDHLPTMGLKAEDYQFYMDLRKYGSTRHSGFGLGFERCVMYLTGMGNIRDVIPFPRTVKNCDL